jgi:hypothetical protein
MAGISVCFAMFVLEVLKGLVDVILMVVDEFPDWVHGVSMVHTGSWPTMTRLVLIVVKDFSIRFFWVILLETIIKVLKENYLRYLIFNYRVFKEVVIVMRTKK